MWTTSTNSKIKQFIWGDWESSTPKSHEISFAHNLSPKIFVINFPEFLKIICLISCKKGSDTVVLCKRSQKDWVTKMNVLVDRDFARLEFKIGFERIC